VASSAIDRPYRGSPTAAPQARWRDWRTLAAVFVALCALLLGCVSSHTTLACDRQAGMCELTRATAGETSARSIALSDITGASLKIIRGARWLRTYQIALETRGGPLELRGAGSEGEMQAFVKDVDGFVRTPGPGRLAAGYGSVWGRLESWAIVLGVIFLMFAYSLPTVRVTADRATQRLVFDLRPFGPLLARQRSYSLAAVRQARVSVRGTPAWVELVLTNDTTVRLAGSVSSRGPCQVLAMRINDVLRA
jgi:hypothetical protein